jgi:hypothetical protein
MQGVSTDLPGGDLVNEGLADLAAGRETESALLVALAAPRLTALGIQVPPGGGARPSHRLYELISSQSDGAHSRYNALLARMVSFVRAAEHASAG